MKKIHYSWQDVEKASNAIIASLAVDKWCPDYIVGVIPNGLSLALLLSNKLDVTLYTLNAQLSTDNTESNLWMADEAFGYNNPEETGITGARWDIGLRKNILIVDGLNDTGTTFNWIKKDWQSSCFPNEQHAWDSVWEKNVRFATMTEDPNSNFGGVKYHWDTVNILDEDTSLVYPWEKEACLKKSSMA